MVYWLCWHFDIQLHTKGQNAMKQVNYILKTYDTKAGDITGALKAAGINVKSVAQVYTEEVAEAETGEEKNE